MKLRLLSWNVHGLPAPITRRRSERLAAIAAQIREHGPDIVALQEVWPGCLRVLVRELAGYTPLFARSAGGHARGGLLILVRATSGFAADEATVRFRRYTLSASPLRVWEGDGLAGKGALFVRVGRDGDRGLWIVDTHLQARYHRDAYPAIRYGQTQELETWIGGLGDEAPVVVAGDFNTPASDERLFPALSRLGIDVTAEERHRSGAATNFPNHSTAAWIDYVFVRAQHSLDVRASTKLIVNDAIDDPYSDHSGLVVDLELEERSARVLAG